MPSFPQHLEISIDRPPVRGPSANGAYIEYKPGPRMTVTIEGDVELVQAYADAVHKVGVETGFIKSE